MSTANTITNISYTGTTQTGNVVATYGIPVTAHIWGAGGGSTAATGTSTLVTANYQGDIQQDPWYGPLIPGKSGYYVLIYALDSDLYDIAWVVVINGIVVYGSPIPNPVANTSRLNNPPPTSLANPTTFRGTTVYTQNGAQAPFRVSVYNFDYTTVTLSSAGAGGGYSRVNFVAKPGDILTVAVGQGGGAGGVTAPPPAPPITWSTRDTNNMVSGQTLYPTTRQNNSALLATYGVWSNLQQAGGTVGNDWFINFPVSGYYTITGSSTGVGFRDEPEGGGAIYISGTAYIFLPGNGGGFTAQVKRYIPAGSYSVYVSAPQASNGHGQASGIAFLIEQANPPKVTTTPTGLPGASYIALLFNTRFPPPNQAALVYAVGNGDSFLDQWGVWEADQNTNSFYRQYSVYFPATANVIFQMSCNNTGTLLLDGDAILSRTAVDNPNTPSQVIISVPAGNHNVVISATGTVGGVNRVGVTFGTGDQTSYSGGRGGISDPTSKQGFGGGGGGATILSLNGVVIGVGAGGGGGASAAPSNITYITTTYTGSLLTNPFPNLLSPETGVVGETIVPGTSGYYAYGRGYYSGASDYTVDNFNPSSWCLVINGVIVYGPAATPPPVTTAQQGQYQGRSYYQPDGYPSLEYTAVQCFSFTYTAVNTGAITDARFNGQNGQDEFNFNTPDTGGGGGGGGGARGGNGGSARGSGGGGTSGHNGMSLGGTAVFPPTGRLPYTNSFYPGGNVAVGGTSVTAANGGNGYIVLEYQTGGGMSVKDSGEWKPVQTVYTKDQGTWKEVQTTYINQDGIWTPVKGAAVPEFTSVNGAFGALVRPSTAGNLTYVAPPPPAPDYGGYSTTGYGSSDMF